MAWAAIDRRRCPPDINCPARSCSSRDRTDVACGSSESAISSKTPHTCTSSWPMAIGLRKTPPVSNATRWNVTIAVSTHAPTSVKRTRGRCKNNLQHCNLLLTSSSDSFLPAHDSHIDNPAYGEVREWPNRAVSKTAVGVTRPWVRSPPSPPYRTSCNPPALHRCIVITAGG